jgi:predicted RNase H-like HicB family nuclease
MAAQAMRIRMPTVNYMAIADQAQGETAWSISFPEFPEIASAAPDERSIFTQAQDALMTAIDAYAADGRVLPEPRFDPRRHPPAEDEGRRVFLSVSAEIPGAWVRVNISLDQGLLQRIDASAKRLGMTRSGFLAEGARRLMEARQE